MIETERKFLVQSDTFKEEADTAEHIIQGFLNTHPERTVRIRITDDFGYLTIKGLSGKSGASRFEWEREIPLKEARHLLLLCEKGFVEKTRYRIRAGDHIIEVDEFHGDNDGLVIAEIELNDEYEPFEKPGWLGKEVTGDIRYYNSQLSNNPFKTWKKEEK